MFAPKVPKAQTKATEKSSSKMPQRSTVLGHRLGHDPVEQALFLQRTIGNQATLRLLAQQTSRQQGSATENTMTGETPRGASWDFSKIPLFPPDRQGSSPQPSIIQRKLVVGQANDPLEHEADRVADQVMRMPAAPEIEPAAAPPQISRKCAACEAEEEEQPQKKEAGTSEATLGEAPASVHEVLRSPGRPLDAATRAYFEPRFGRDFSGVRVHTDARAAASAAAVQARAYTVGSNVAFGADEYAPATTQGRELLAHELAHTVQQQRGGGTALSPGANVSLEASAEAAASLVTRGGHLTAGLPAAGVGLARKPTEDDERAKAVAEAKAVAARIDQQLADADKDDEPEPKTPSRFLPGGFTDKEADAVYKEAESRRKLLSMALVLAERQAKRYEFWHGNPSYNSADIKEAFDLDLYWDPKEEGFIRQPYVSKDEDIVNADPEASRLYSDRLWDLTENKPEKKSRFKRVMDAVCSHTEPCASNIEQMHRDKEAGMSDAEAINRGMARLTVFAETLALPTPGPSGPVAIGPGGTPSGMPYNVPATEPAIPARGEPTVAPRPKPLETTGGGGSKGPGPPVDQPASVADDAVPDSNLDDAPTNRVPQKPLEQVGEFKIDGKKSFDGKTFSREIEGLYGDRGRITDVRPVRDLVDRFCAEAKAHGAKELRVTGKVVRDPNIMRLKRLVEHLGGTVRKIDEQTIEFTIPID